MDLPSMDISIILTCSNAEKFAELNAIGQWLGMKDVIDLYYDDQLNQAVRAEEQRVGRYGHARVHSQTLIFRQDESGSSSTCASNASTALPRTLRGRKSGSPSASTCWWRSSKRNFGLNVSLHTLLQILSLTLFEKLPLKQAVAGVEPIETNPHFTGN